MASISTCAISFLLSFEVVLTSYSCLQSLQDLAGRESVEVLLSQSPQELKAVISTLPSGIQDRLGAALMSNYKQLYDQLLPIQFYELKGHTDSITSVAFSSDGRLVLTGSYDETARLWNLATLETIKLKGHAKQINSVAFSHDCKFALTGSKDRTARLWDLATLKSIELKGHAGSIYSVVFSPDSKFALTGSWDKTARLWNLATLKPIELKRHTGAITSVAFSSDGRFVLTGSWDTTACLWNLATLESTELKGHHGLITSVAFSPDDKFALTGSYDKTARLWNLATLELIELKGHRGNVYGVAFSFDGKFALTGSYDETARLWNLATLESTELKGHTHWISSVAFSPDSKFALTGSYDKIARLWILPNKILTLEQLLFIIQLKEGSIDLTRDDTKDILESLSSHIDALPQLPSKDYTSNPLIKAYIDVKRNQLLKAAATDDVATVKMLLSKGFNSLYTCDKAGNNLWHYAFKGHSVDGIVYPSAHVINLLVKLEGLDKGLLKLNKAGLPPFAVGLFYNKEFTAHFIQNNSKITRKSWCTIS